MKDSNKTWKQRVRERAYELWEEAGRPHGYADFFWYEAEHQIEEEDNWCMEEEFIPDNRNFHYWHPTY